MANHFIKLTRESGEVIFVNAALISAMGLVDRGCILNRVAGKEGVLITFVRLGDALDHVRETPDEIFALMSDKA